jgi:hypothetical protein
MPPPKSPRPANLGAPLAAATPPAAGAAANLSPTTNITEAALLALARDVARLAASGASLRDGLAMVVAACTEPKLRRARLAALLNADESRSLALAWAREQLRVALEELLTRPQGIALRRDVPAEALSWFLLAGCEAIAHEPPGDADERIDALLRLAREAAPPA